MLIEGKCANGYGYISFDTDYVEWDLRDGAAIDYQAKQVNAGDHANLDRPHAPSDEIGPVEHEGSRDSVADWPPHFVCAIDERGTFHGLEFANTQPADYVDLDFTSGCRDGEGGVDSKKRRKSAQNVKRNALRGKKGRRGDVAHRRRRHT